MGMDVYVLACESVEAEVVFETGSFTEPRAHWLARLAGQQALGSTCFYTHPLEALGLQMHRATRAFYVGVGELNSVSRAWTYPTHKILFIQDESEAVQGERGMQWVGLRAWES